MFTGDPSDEAAVLVSALSDGRVVAREALSDDGGGRVGAMRTSVELAVGTEVDELSFLGVPKRDIDSKARRGEPTLAGVVDEN